MEKNQLIRNNGNIYRILAVDDDSVLLVDCLKKTMPKWYAISDVSGYSECTEEELLESTGTVLVEEEKLSPKTQKTIHERFTVVAGQCH